MTHPTQSLRDKVWSVLNNVWAGDSEEDLYIKTDAILDLVREALLSDVAVQKAGFNIWAEVADGTMNADIYREEGVEIAVTALTAALDAVIGEDDR